MKLRLKLLRLIACVRGYSSPAYRSRHQGSRRRRNGSSPPPPPRQIERPQPPVLLPPRLPSRSSRFYLLRRRQDPAAGSSPSPPRASSSPTPPTCPHRRRPDFEKVQRGEKIGTLFHNEANFWDCSKKVTTREMAVAAKDSSRHLQITSLARSIRVIADMEDPISHTLKKTEIAKDLVYENMYCPLGVLRIIFESCSDALVQIAAVL